MEKKAIKEMKKEILTGVRRKADRKAIKWFFLDKERIKQLMYHKGEKLKITRQSKNKIILQIDFN